jgi:hypothetical protein
MSNKEEGRSGEHLAAPATLSDNPLRERKRELEERLRALREDSAPSPSPPPHHSAGLRIQTPRQRARLLEQQLLHGLAAACSSPPFVKGTEPQEQHETDKALDPPIKDISVVTVSTSSSFLDNDVLEQKDVLTELDRFELALARTCADHEENPRSQELLRRVSVLRVHVDKEKRRQGQEQEHDERQETAFLLKRRQSRFWKERRHVEKKQRKRTLLIELEAVEAAVLTWNSAPKSSTRPCLREIAIFRISAMTALDDYPEILHSILIELTEIENILMDSKAEKKRSEWHRSKEAVRRIAGLKSRLAQDEDNEAEPDASEGLEKSKQEKDKPLPVHRRFSRIAFGRSPSVRITEAPPDPQRQGVTRNRFGSFLKKR